MEKVAVIVETREHKALPFVLQNVMSILPKDWCLQVFHGINNIDYVKEAVNKLKCKVFLTNLEIEEISADDSSLEIMLTKKFWNDVKGETVLYFECDTMLCPNSEFKVNEFEDFDI